jgi:hypothetical protein
MSNSVFITALWRLGRLFNTSALRIIQPPVIRAPDVGSLDPSIGERSAPMGALLRYQTVPTILAPVKDQLFAQDTDTFDGFFLELSGNRNGMPVAAQQLTGGSPRSDLS